MTRPGLSSLALATLLAGCLGESWREAEADLGPVTLAMGLKPMPGLQSDWHRRLSLQGEAGALELPLFEDTGWWRGSALYLTTENQLVLDEGQAGLLRFCPSPPREAAPGVPCPPPGIGTGPAPPSRRHPGWTYLGRFDENHDPAGPVWRGWHLAPEPDMPEPL